MKSEKSPNIPCCHQPRLGRAIQRHLSSGAERAGAAALHGWIAWTAPSGAFNFHGDEQGIEPTKIWILMGILPSGKLKTCLLFGKYGRVR